MFLLANDIRRGLVQFSRPLFITHVFNKYFFVDIFFFTFPDDDESNNIDFSVHSNFHSHFFRSFCFRFGGFYGTKPHFHLCAKWIYRKMNWQTIGLNKGEREWQNIVLKFISGFFSFFFCSSKAYGCANESAIAMTVFFCRMYVCM